MAKRVFITGISGFAGSYLAKHLTLTGGYEVFGSVYGSTFVPEVDEKNLFPVNLMDIAETKKIIAQVKPHWLFHLAALTSPAESFENPAAHMSNNITAQVHVLEALREVQGIERVMVTGSAEEYGFVSKEENPLTEMTPLRPASPYAVSKIAQDFMGYQYFKSYGLPIIRVRPFNHTGPGQSPAFVISSFAKQIAEIEAQGIDGILQVGNLESVRDFTAVEDMVRAYELVMQKGLPGDVYNLGSGEGTQIQTIVDLLVGMAKVRIETRVDPSRLRPSDTPVLICDAGKFKQLTGWRLKKSLESTLKDVLDYWRQHLPTPAN